MIEEYLKTFINLSSGKAKGYFKWLLEKGKYYEVDLEKSESILKSKVGLNRKVMIKECFNNSFLAVNYIPHLKYVEGFYCLDEIKIPLSHAWNSDEGTGLDFTVSKFNFGPGEFFGVEIPLEVLVDFHTSKDSGYDSLFFYYLNYISNEKELKLQ